MKPFFLNGQWVKSQSFEAVHNPWNQKKLADVCVADAVQVEQAVATAHAAFEKTRVQPAWERSNILSRVADLIGERRQEFIDTLVAEAGKPVTFAEAETDRAMMTFRFASQLALADEGHGVRMDGSPQGVGHYGIVNRFPLGVILGITPFNFPLNLVAHKVAPCIASGNTMLLKPALKTPLSSLLLAEVLEAAGVPAGQMNVVPFGHAFIPKLLVDDRIKMLSFTGSADVGWKLKTQAVKQKIALELGGNAAVIVEPDSDWRPAIAKIANGAFGYAGQSCISVQRIFVHKDIFVDFRNLFVEFVKTKIPVGDPANRATVVGPMINKFARDKVVAWVQEALSEGATLLTPLKAEGDSLLGPLVIEGARKSSKVVCLEAFAPLVVLESYDSFEDALSLVNDSQFGLQAGVFSPDVKKAFRAFQTLDVGGVLINQVPTFRVENMPYGGVKESGFGREGVRYAMEEMTELRSLILNIA